MFSPRSSVIGHLWGAFKNRRVPYHRHSVVSRNPQSCGGVEKHPTRTRYEINMFCLSGGCVPVPSRPILDIQDIN